MQTSKASVIITAPDLIPVVETVAAKLNIPDEKILIFGQAQETPNRYRSWDGLFQHGEEDWVRFDDEEVSKEIPACLVTTSGTTGLPKMAILSHHAWVALNCVIDDPNPKPYQIKR